VNGLILHRQMLPELQAAWTARSVRQQLSRANADPLIWDSEAQTALTAIRLSGARGYRAADPGFAVARSSFARTFSRPASSVSYRRRTRSRSVRVSKDRRAASDALRNALAFECPDSLARRLDCGLGRGDRVLRDRESGERTRQDGVG
jgi:hypothetical protein